MIRISAFVWVLILGLLGVGLFQVKYNVQSKEVELRRINKQIDANHSAIHVLDAEWSYLNDPNRLADLTRRHTDLVPTEATQIKRFSDLPPRPATAQPDLPALSTAAPSTAAPSTGTAIAAAPAVSTPASAQPAARVVQVSATPGSAPTAMPAVASTTAAAGNAKVAAAPAKPAATPASGARNTAQAATKPAATQPATQAPKPGADEVIDAILADMQRKQSTTTTPPAGDQ
jgi:hypothetical protein